MFVPFNDLSRIHKPILSNSVKKLEKTILRNDLILSQDIAEFESEYSRYTKQKYTITCANGTDAIELILLGLGIKHGDEVIVPANTFIATALAVVRTGATPIFVDNNENNTLHFFIKDSLKSGLNTIINVVPSDNAEYSIIDSALISAKTKSNIDTSYSHNMGSLTIFFAFV